MERARPSTPRLALATTVARAAAIFGAASCSLAPAGTGPDAPGAPDESAPGAGPSSAPSHDLDAASTGTTGSGPYVPYDGGAAVIGAVGSDGGALSRIFFAVVGDTRPATVDDTPGYPTAIVSSIYAGIRSLRPQVPMVVSTGDYLFASVPPGPEGSQAASQLALYMQIRSRFQGAFFPAMGNHECTGATNSNCGIGAADGVTANYGAFVHAMLAPIGKSTPYYVIDLAADDATWTAKFVFIAANAWSSAQEAWFDATMARPTTYTFVVRHEPASADTAPGVTPSERVMAAHPYTLAIVGHSHTYRHDRATPREVLIGNGGAPLASKDYGFGVFSQRGDGAIDVDMLDWQTGRADASFHFAVGADGSPAR